MQRFGILHIWGVKYTDLIFSINAIYFVVFFGVEDAGVKVM
jgi:hypothetical protein